MGSVIRPDFWSYDLPHPTNSVAIELEVYFDNEFESSVCRACARPGTRRVVNDNYSYPVCGSRECLIVVVNMQRFDMNQKRTKEGVV